MGAGSWWRLGAGPAAVALLLLLLATVAAPAAAKASSHFTLTIDPFTAPVVPRGDPASTTVTLRLQCGPAFTPPSPLESFRAAVSVASAAPELTVIPVPAEFLFDPATCITPGIVQTLELVGGIITPAPAFSTSAFSLTATAESGPATPGATATAEGSVTVGYYSLHSIHMADHVFALREGGRTTRAATLQHFGNGPTVCSFAVLSAPAGLEVTVPEPFTLAAVGPGGAPSTVVEFGFHARDADTMGRNPARVEIGLRTGYAPTGEPAGPGTTIGFLVEVTSGLGPGLTASEGAVGAWSAALALVAAGVAVLVWRSRRATR